MKQYCFNGTADLRLLWELRAGMRTGERMCGDLRTESFLSFFLFFEVRSGLDSPSRRQPFICLLYDGRQKTALHTELNCFCFCKRCVIQFIFLRLNGWEGIFVVLHLTAASTQSPTDQNAGLIIGVINMKPLTVSGSVAQGEVGILSIQAPFFMQPIQQSINSLGAGGLRNGLAQK